MCCVRYLHGERKEGFKDIRKEKILPSQFLVRWEDKAVLENLSGNQQQGLELLVA